MNGGVLGHSSSRLMLDSLSLKSPEDPGAHAITFGEGSSHLPPPSYFTVEGLGDLSPSHPFLLTGVSFYCPLCQERPLLS